MRVSPNTPVDPRSRPTATLRRGIPLLCTSWRGKPAAGNHRQRARRIGVFTPFAYYSTTKYVNENQHAFTFDYAAISKPWFDTLPADLQAMVLATAEEIGTIVNHLEN